MKKLAVSLAAASLCTTFVGAADARSTAYPGAYSNAYDGSWNLVFVTRRGACDPTYNFSVNINRGIVTNPNLVRFRGYVARSGVVHASVVVQDKFAGGSRAARAEGPGADVKVRRGARDTGLRNGRVSDRAAEHIARFNSPCPNLRFRAAAPS